MNTAISYPFRFDGRLEGQTTASTDGVPLQQYAGWTDLELEDITVTDAPDPGATQVEFAARHTVHIIGEFHAQQGSEVHLLTEETFPDCNDTYSGMAPQPPEARLAQPKSAAEPDDRTGRIELRFLPNTAPLQAYPNPCVERSTIVGGPQGPFTVFDAQGAVVHRSIKRTDQLTVDTRQWLPGVYRIRVDAPDGPQTFSITKVR